MQVRRIIAQWVLLTAIAVAGAPLAYGFQQPARPALPNFDRRRDALAAPASVPVEKAAAAARLRQRLPQARIDFDEVTGAPKRISTDDGFLSGVQGRGRAISFEAAAGWPENDRHRATRAFLKTHRELFGHGPEVLEQAWLQRDYVTPHNGLRTTVWAQELDGIAVFEAVLVSHITKHEELVSISSQFVADAESAANAGARQRWTRHWPTLSAKQAIANAAQSLGEPIASGDLMAGAPAADADQRQRFQAARFNREIDARLVWLPMNSALLRLCWEVKLTSRTRGETFRLLVDAHSGEICLRRCLTVYQSAATYRVFTSDSPSPFSPGQTIASSGQPALVQRSLITLAALNTNASPKGWIDDGSNETRGNNVDAHLDRDADDGPDLPRPQGVPFRVFDFPLDLAQSPAAYGDAAVVQLFYWCNWMHDRLYELGFTEAAGNYQSDNLGRGGLGGDAVQADAQDGSGFNNANFTPSDDGLPPRIQMYLFTGPNPDRDGDLDAEIILHEYTHGLSERLVGGGLGLGALQSAGMSEGWSDFYALALLSESSDDAGGVYAFGGYATYQLDGLTENYYYGIRRYPYSTDLLKNPLTFKDIDPLQISPHPDVPRNPTADSDDGAEVHNQGEVWCSALWEVRANLIAKHGFASGNPLTLQLVTDGLKLAPANPNFLEARDAILQADVVDTGGDNAIELWRAFAKRGLGYSATSPPSSTTLGVHEAFDLPDDLHVAEKEFVSRGPVNGPFLPNSQTYTLINVGSNVLTWHVAATSLWLNVSPSSGTLLPGGLPASVTFSLSPSASLLPQGIYADTVLFTNQASGRIHGQQVILRVGQPDYFTERFTSRDNDLTHQSFTFTPDGSLSFYSVCREPATSFPTDPADGINVSLADDDSVAVTLANDAEVSLYGQRTNTFFIGSNGYLTLGQSDSGYVESAGNHFRLPRVACLFDDLNPAVGGVISWKQLNDRVAVTYADVPEFGGTGHTNSFQIEWFFNGRIRLTCLHIESVDGLIGLSPGQGVPLGFEESDFSAYGACTLPLRLTVPAMTTEGIGVWAGQGQVTLTAPALDDVVVSLTSSDTSEIVVPPSVRIGEGETGATFDLVVLDDADLDGTQTVGITASAPGYMEGRTQIAVHDNESAVLSVSLPPALREGDPPTYGMVQLSAPPASYLVVELRSSHPAQLQVPSAVVLAPGQTSGIFSLTAVDDLDIDGPQEVSVTAHVEHWTDGSATMTVLDNESQEIRVVLPASAREGDGELANLGGIGLSGALPTNLVISLSSSAPTDLAVPPFVVVPAGQLAVAFNLQIGDDAEENRGRSVTVTANASGFASGLGSMFIRDNEVPADRIGILPQRASLVAESCRPPNGVIDPGETVTVALALFNSRLGTTTNLTATLLESGGVASPSAPQLYGVLAPDGPARTNYYTFTANGSCGDVLRATFQLQDGPNDLGRVTQDYRLGRPAVVFTESFDGVAPPLLPADWITESDAGPAWSTMGNSTDTAPNVAFMGDNGSPSESWLRSPSLLIPSASAQLSFRHRFDTESCCDGGSLELATDGGAFLDILDAGGSFVANGYTGFAVNRAAWTGISPGFITTVVNLPVAAAGRQIQLRWRFTSDASVGGLGWFVDTVALTDGFACCDPQTPAPVIESIRQLGDRVTISWQAIPGRTYRLQYKSSLGDGFWSEVAGEIVANSNQASQSEALGNARQRFYRVMLLP